eukprot:TRINITY_DN4115_c2_g1_i1.p1 TRINITY_DN4115_c2_g1~~TRINITY_DN4115_c2_g1_i1.p1  ORF type:complete len:781 (+),score=117.07 TRINITY_DN4115_c2_g1_i1:342-2345(+)
MASPSQPRSVGGTVPGVTREWSLSPPQPGLFGTPPPAQAAACSPEADELPTTALTGAGARHPPPAPHNSPVATSPVSGRSPGPERPSASPKAAAAADARERLSGIPIATPPAAGAAAPSPSAAAHPQPAPPQQLAQMAVLPCHAQPPRASRRQSEAAADEAAAAGSQWARESELRTAAPHSAPGSFHQQRAGAATSSALGDDVELQSAAESLPAPENAAGGVLVVPAHLAGELAESEPPQHPPRAAGSWRLHPTDLSQVGSMYTAVHSVGPGQLVAASRAPQADPAQQSQVGSVYAAAHGAPPRQQRGPGSAHTPADPAEQSLVGSMYTLHSTAGPQDGHGFAVSPSQAALEASSRRGSMRPPQPGGGGGAHPLPLAPNQSDLSAGVPNATVAQAPPPETWAYAAATASSAAAPDGHPLPPPALAAAQPGPEQRRASAAGSAGDSAAAPVEDQRRRHSATSSAAAPPAEAPAPLGPAAPPRDRPSFPCDAAAGGGPADEAPPASATPGSVVHATRAQRAGPCVAAGGGHRASLGQGAQLPDHCTPTRLLQPGVRMSIITHDVAPLRRSPPPAVPPPVDAPRAEAAGEEIILTPEPAHRRPAFSGRLMSPPPDRREDELWRGGYFVGSAADLPYASPPSAIRTAIAFQYRQLCSSRRVVSPPQPRVYT